MSVESAKTVTTTPHDDPAADTEIDRRTGLHTNRWNSSSGTGLARHIANASHFLRDLSVEMRFGELTRAPLRLLRLQILDQAVECDWLARAPDPWDIGLPRHLQQRHTGIQTLRDAIDVRDLIFHSLPHVETAHFCVYRESPGTCREMVVTGSSERSDSVLRRVRSLAMQAKLLGFRFSLENGVLHEISVADPAPCSQGNTA